MSKLTVGVISRDEALKLAPDYVKYVETHNWEYIDTLLDSFEKLKRGQKVLTYRHADKQFVIGKITSKNSNDIRAIDGPIVRFSNGEYTWRIDGSGYAVAV